MSKRESHINDSIMVLFLPLMKGVCIKPVTNNMAKKIISFTFDVLILLPKLLYNKGEKKINSLFFIVNRLQESIFKL